MSRLTALLLCIGLLCQDIHVALACSAPSNPVPTTTTTTATTTTTTTTKTTFLAACNLRNAISRAFFTGFNADCTGVDATDPAVEDCTIQSGETFTVAGDACGTGNRPFLVDGNETTPTNTVTYQCTDGVLSSSGGIVNAGDINEIACLGQCSFCILDPAFDMSEVTNDAICCTAGCCVVDDGETFVMSTAICNTDGTNNPLRITSAGTTSLIPAAAPLTDTTSFTCASSVITGTQGATTIPTVTEIGCQEASCTISVPEGDKAHLNFDANVDCTTAIDVCTIRSGVTGAFDGAGCSFSTFSVFASSLPAPLSAGIDPSTVNQLCTDGDNQGSTAAVTSLVCTNGLLSTPALYAEAFGGSTTRGPPINFAEGAASGISNIRCLSVPDLCIPCFSCDPGDCPQCTPPS